MEGPSGSHPLFDSRVARIDVSGPRYSEAALSRGRLSCFRVNTQLGLAGGAAVPGSSTRQPLVSLPKGRTLIHQGRVIVKGKSL